VAGNTHFLPMWHRHFCLCRLLANRRSSATVRRSLLSERCCDGEEIDLVTRNPLQPLVSRRFSLIDLRCDGACGPRQHIPSVTDRVIDGPSW
jgi:hypothetical protein